MSLQGATSMQTETLTDSDEWNRRNPAASARARRIADQRKAAGRRTKIDPTTTDRQYTGAELEFMMAMQEHKRRTGRMFPTWGEVLEVLQSLGYTKPGDE